MTDQSCDLIQRLTDALERLDNHCSDELFDLLDEARDYLAMSDGPAAPDGSEPTDEELLAAQDQAVTSFPPIHPEASPLSAVEYARELEIRKARAVLARYGNRTPAPIPLSERQPTEADCTTDGEAWYWDQIAGCWFFLPGPPLNNHYTHWLPHWALPVPE